MANMVGFPHTPKKKEEYGLWTILVPYPYPHYKAAEREQNRVEQWVMFGKIRNNMGNNIHATPHYKAAEREQNGTYQWVMFGKIRNIASMVGQAPHPKKGTIIWAVGARSNTYTHYKAAEREHIELPHTIMFGKILNNMAPQNNNMPNKESHSSLLGTLYYIYSFGAGKLPNIGKCCGTHNRASSLRTIFVAAHTSAYQSGSYT